MTIFSRSLRSLSCSAAAKQFAEKLCARRRRPQRLKPALQTSVIAAVNRCAIQNQIKKGSLSRKTIRKTLYSCLRHVRYLTHAGLELRFQDHVCRLWGRHAGIFAFNGDRFLGDFGEKGHGFVAHPYC
jgi:hypothetical protein